MNTQNIKEISELFGKKSSDDKVVKDGDNIIYKGEKYNVKKRGVEISKDKSEKSIFNDTISEMAATLETLWEVDNFKSLHTISHENVEGPPYGDCGNNVQELFQNTKDRLRGFLSDLEKFEKERELEKPNFIAFYRPFHFYPQSWGIYLDIQKLIAQASKIYAYNLQSSPNLIPGLTFDDAVRISVFKTYFHEMYHHKFEMFASKLELATRKAYYVEGFHRYYCATCGTDSCLEEAFANCNGLFASFDYLHKNQIIDPLPRKDYKKLIREALLKNAPEGYRVSYELTANELEYKMYENKFLEILFDFCFQVFYGVSPIEINPDLWDLSTYRLDPLVNTNNEVTFILP